MSDEFDYPDLITPPPYPSLLPPNQTKLERALAEQTGRLDNALPVPIDLLLQVWKIPAGYLPWLAWHLSLDLWDWRWDEFKKRSVTAKAIILARSKGTLNGMRLHTEVMDTEVKQAIRPPQGTFASAILSKEDIDAWLRQMPQIRVYLARERGSAVGLTFMREDTAVEALPETSPPTYIVARSPTIDHISGVGLSPQDFFGAGYGNFDAGRALEGRAARLWWHGVEQHLLIWDISTERQTEQGIRIERVSIPGHANSGMFVGRYLDHYYADSVKVKAKVVTWRQDLTYDHSVSSLAMTSIYPGLEPIDVRWEREYTTGHDHQAAFCGRFLVGRPALSGQTTKQIFACADMAPWLIYDRIILHDPTIAAKRVEGAWSFLNYSRLGFPKFTAKAVIDLKDKLHRKAFVSEGFLTASTFLVPQDMTKYNRARLAVRVSKAARDRILTTHKLTRPVTFDDGIPFSFDFTREPRVPFRL